MARRFEGQIAVVTGGSTDVGLAAAKRFATARGTTTRSANSQGDMS